MVDTIVDTGVDMARMTLTGGITLSGFVDSIASNALMEFATAGTAPPGSARTVKNAVDNALDSGDTQALRAAEGSAGNVSGGSAAARASQGSGGSGGTPLLTGNTINTPRLTDGGGGGDQSMAGLNRVPSIDSGYFGTPGQHGSSRVRHMPGGNSAAQEFYDDITHGYINETPIENGGFVRALPDGTTITYRPTSTSDGTPVVDINNGSIYKSQKIHFINEEGK